VPSWSPMPPPLAATTGIVGAGRLVLLDDHCPMPRRAMSGSIVVGFLARTHEQEAPDAIAARTVPATERARANGCRLPVNDMVGTDVIVVRCL